VALAQLVRFLVVKLNHPDSNSRFDMGVVFTANYLFSEKRLDVSVDSDTLLVTDFVNLNIKPTQSFKGAHRGRMCVRACMIICVCTLFHKKLLKKIHSALSKTCPWKIETKIRARSVVVFWFLIGTTSRFYSSEKSNEKSRFFKKKYFNVQWEMFN
jgi:hypothetical protein